MPINECLTPVCLTSGFSIGFGCVEAILTEAADAEAADLSGKSERIIILEVIVGG